MPKRDRPRVDPADRLRPDRHRPGLRVRLLRHPGLPGARAGGLPRHPRQLEPGHDHDRPRVRRRHLHRAARRRRARRIIEREQPDAVLPTLGGQTALNLAMELVERGAVDTPGTPELIGANAEAIPTAEDREQFKVAMQEIGLAVPPSGVAHSHRRGARRSPSASACPSSSGPPTSSAARAPASPRTPEEFTRLAAIGLAASPITEILIEQSIAGWKEYELEVMRDRADNCVIICSIENLDPMGVHTGDSITVAPGPDAVRRRVPAHARRRLRLHPPRRRRDRRLERAVRPRPRQRRHGHHRDEPAGVAVVGAGVEGHRVPDRQDRRQARRRLHARRDPQRHHQDDAGQLRADHRLRRHQGARAGRSRSSPARPGVLGTSMQSVGEAMAIGRTFPESLQKALRSLEHGRLGLNCDPAEAALDDLDDDELLAPGRHRHPRPPLPARGRAAPRHHRRGARRAHQGRPVVPRPDPRHRRGAGRPRRGRLRRRWTGAAWRRAKRLGFADAQLAWLWRVPEADVRAARLAAGVRATFKTVDTCAAEFEAADAVPLLDLRGRGRGRATRAARR